METERQIVTVDMLMDAKVRGGTTAAVQELAHGGSCCGSAVVL